MMGWSRNRAWGWLIPALVGVIGICLTLLGFQGEWEADEREARADLELQIEWLARDFQYRVLDAYQPVELLASFITSQSVGTIDTGEFHRMAIKARGDRPISRLFWALFVSADARDSFENTARTRGDLPDYFLWELDSQRQPIVAGVRPEYFPIRRLETFDQLPSIMGFDLFSDPNRRATAERARDEGIPVGISPGAPILTNITGTILPVYWPVYRTLSTPSGVEERRENFRSIVAGLIPMKDMLKLVSQDLLPGGLQSIAVFMDHPRGTPYDQPLAALDIASTEITIPSASLAGPQGLRLSRTFQQFGRDWTLVFDFGPGALDGPDASDPWKVLAVGLVLTALLVGFLVREQQRRATTENLVVQRTREFRQAADELAAVVDSSPMAIAGLNMQRHVVTWNKAAEHMFGFSADEVLNRPFPIVVPGAEDKFFHRFNEVVEGRIVRGREGKRLHKYGTIVDTRTSTAALRAPDGTVRGVVYAMEDITEAKQMEARAHETRERLQALVDNSVDGVVLIDARGTVLIFNPAAERLFGYCSDEVVGRNVKMLMPQPYAGEHDGYLTNYHSSGDRKIIGIGREVTGRRKDGSTFPMHLAVGEAKQDGQSIFVGNIHDLTERRAAEAIFGYTADEMIGNHISEVGYEGATDSWHANLETLKRGQRVARYETKRRRKDGAIRDILLAVSPIHDAEGMLVGVSGMARDITAAKVAERAAKESEDKYRSTFDIAPVGIVHTSPTGDFLMVNDYFCQMIGYGRDELLSLNALAITDPDFVEESQQALDVRSSVNSFIKKYVRKDGQPVWCELTVAPQHDDRGRMTHFITIISDISARKNAEERQQQLSSQLQQSQKMEAIGQLTGGMAHDFNNLLSVILGNLDFLEEKFTAESDELNLTQSAIEAATRGADLTRRLLAFARRQPLAPKLTDLSSVLEGAAHLFRRTLGESVSLEVQLAHDLWPVMIDVAQLESAILNLAVNARDAMPNGGKLTIEARNVTLDEAAAKLNLEAEPGDYLVVSVSDTGCGMPPDVIAKAFDPFFTTKGARGTGLGLSMVHGFVRQSGGHTRIYSEVGRGTTIRLYLPRAQEATAPAEEETTSQQLLIGTETILVVEDNQSLRDLALRALKELGYRTIPAGDGAEALDIVRGGAPFDLLFTDVVMPGGVDGRQLAEAARRMRPGLKVLFTSGFTAAAASAAMTEEFGSNLLTKPYRKEELARYIRTALDNRD